jgi:hypothetical protein
MDILDVIIRGARSVADNDDSTSLRHSAEQFLRVYARFHGYRVVAASPQAERVLGAAMMLSPEIRGGVYGHTVIFDVNIASGTLLARAARRLRDSGNRDRLVGIALHSLVGEARDWATADLSELVVADLVGSHSGLRKPAERRDDGVVLAG